MTITEPKRRLAVSRGAIAAFVVALSGCGGSHNQPTHRSETVAYSQRPSAVLSLSGLGTFQGTCPPGVRSWTLRFIDDSRTTETVSYRIGSGARHTVNTDHVVTFHLVPGATRTHEPAFVPPAGQPRGLTNAMSLPTTSPLDAAIYQATEPHTLLADVHLALSSIGGGQCDLVGSTVKVYTYSNAR